MDLSAALDERVARKAVHLLPQPQSALRLRKLVAAPNHTLKEVVAAVMLDPMLAAAVMRIANSAAYSRGNATTSLASAVQRIGEKELSRLALAAGLGSATNAAGPLLEVRRAAMTRALTSAVLCERLANLFGLDPETMFLAGLLHDVGVQVALGTLELITSQHKDTHLARASAEWLDLSNKHHIELGALLGEKWGLPEKVCEAIATHHAQGELSAATALVRLSDQLSSALDAGQALTVEHHALLSFDDETKKSVVARLVTLPAMVAALAGDDPLPSCVSLVLSSAKQEKKGPSFSARLGRARTATVTVLSATELHIDVAGGMSANQIEELEIATPQGPLKLWVRVESVSAAGDGRSRAGAVPFSPSREALAMLDAMSKSEPMERAA